MNYFKNIFSKSPKVFPEDVLLELPSDSSRLTAELNQSIEEYREGIEAKWTFHPAEYGDITNVSTTRDYIHMLLEKLDALRVNPDTSILRSLDKEWQAWCIQRIAIDFKHKERYSSEARNIPKTEWWWWIDRLDQLDVNQRTTL